MPTTGSWTEQDMLADLIKVWGEFGAHADMFRWILRMNAELKEQNIQKTLRIDALKQHIEEIEDKLYMYIEGGNDL